MTDDPNSSQNGIAGTPQAIAAPDRALRTAIIGSSIIMWILALFIIYAMYGIKRELVEIKQNLPPADSSLALYQLVDANGKVVYSFSPSTPAAADIRDMEGSSMGTDSTGR